MKSATGPAAVADVGKAGLMQDATGERAAVVAAAAPGQMDYREW